jgi:D-alanyl-D-alanine carboxypeptidase (penicillin-binding protein 5/6)
LRRLLAGLTTLGAAVLCTAFPASAAPASGPLPPDVAVGEGAEPVPDGLSSGSWLVADLTTGHVLAAKAGSALRAPASTQKLLTALTFGGPGAPTEITVTPADVTTTGRTVGLSPGVRYRTSDLIDAMLVSSGNDVAQAVAQPAGSPTAAGDRMTATARQLGATDTTASNATGLDADGQLTTAYDLAVLTRAALDRPELRRAMGLPTLTVTGSDGRSRRLSSSNPLLGRYDGFVGGKTGSTDQAGQTFVGVAERGGTTLAVVLMQAPSSFSREASSLLDWGFRAAPATAGIAALPDPAAPTAAASQPTSQPTVPPLAEDGGGVSPLLAFALAATVIAAAFTYWQGHDELGKAGRRRPPRRGPSGEPRGSGRRVIDLRDPPGPGSSEASDTRTSPSGPAERHSSSVRDSRSIFAP